MKYHNLKPITKDTIIYARPNGWAFHLDRNCIMLSGSQFKDYGYVQIKKADIERRKLAPCACAYKEGK